MSNEMWCTKLYGFHGDENSSRGLPGSEAV
jgi:hypothetical protein